MDVDAVAFQLNYCVQAVVKIFSGNDDNGVGDKYDNNNGQR